MFTRKVQREYIRSGVKDWANAGYELETIGHRLDSARRSLARSKKNTWAYKFWSTVESRLMSKWQQTIMLKDVGLRQEVIKEQDIRTYDWWEKTEEVGTLGVDFWAFLSEKLGPGPNLTESWEKAKEIKLQKARQGLA